MDIRPNLPPCRPTASRRRRSLSLGPDRHQKHTIQAAPKGQHTTANRLQTRHNRRRDASSVRQDDSAVEALTDLQSPTSVRRSAAHRVLGMASRRLRGFRHPTPARQSEGALSKSAHTTQPKPPRPLPLPSRPTRCSKPATVSPSGPSQMRRLSRAGNKTTGHYTHPICKQTGARWPVVGTNELYIGDNHTTVGATPAGRGGRTSAAASTSALGRG